ncbi:MAG: hypothetical protein AAF411_03645 [Myxococcota bacterium]
MSRSAVLSGRIDARDRAKQRRRLDRALRPELSPYEAIWAWLERSKLDELTPNGMRRLDLNAYLMRTGEFSLPPAERLRQLAIFVEPSFNALAHPALDRVYEAALRYDDASAELWHSRGISAKYAAESFEDGAQRSKLVALSRRCLYRAWELQPDDAGIAYSMGLWHYFFGEDRDETAEWFERALRLEPSHGYARLYRAHCLHDAARWAEAVEAYEAVPLNTFTGPKAWLVDLHLEALAYCRLRAGDRDGSLAGFDALCTRFEKEPMRMQWLARVYLREASQGELKVELGARFNKLIELGKTLELP